MTGRVIAISGPPGAGKTTIGRWLTETRGAVRVNYDDFETVTRKPPPEIADWLARGAPIDEIEAPGLEAAVRGAKSKGDVIYETPLGRAWTPTAELIDVSLWIDTPLDLALSRKLQIIARAWHDKGGAVEPCANWLKGHLIAYEEIIRPSLLVQMERVRARADHFVRNDTDLDSTKRYVSKWLTSKNI